MMSAELLYNERPQWQDVGGLGITSVYITYYTVYGTRTIWRVIKQKITNIQIATKRKAKHSWNHLSKKDSASWV